MYKSEYQVIKFLQQYDFKSEMDWKVVSSFCAVELKLNFEFIPKISSDGINSLDFSEWYEKGFGSGEIAILNGQFVIIGACNLEVAKIEGALNGDEISTDRFETEIARLSKASEEGVLKFNQVMMLNKLQYAESNQLITERYLPGTNDRVSFHKHDVRGIGVIRSISQEDNRFELYCYHIYQTGETRFSMHEEIRPLSEYTFDVMSISERRRLENWLKKSGKSWNDKMHRIEPVDPKAENGKKYWYITDKMKLASSVEEGKPTSHFRYLGGNYFLTHSDGLTNLGKIVELLRDFLAR